GVTYAQLDRATAALGARLARVGVGKGTRVGLMMPNGVEWAVTAVATMRMGAVLVPLSTLLRPPELAAHLRVAGVEHLVCVRSFRGRDYVDDLGRLGVVATGEPRPFDAPDLPELRSVRVWEEWQPGGLDDLLGDAHADDD